MGSFNTSCFVSRQTIASGDACRVIAILQARTWEDIELTFGDTTTKAAGFTNSTCYPERFWQPLSTFIEAEYDDYGEVKLKDTRRNRADLMALFWDALRKTPIVAQGENKSHDVPYDLATFMAKEAPKVYAALTVKDSGVNIQQDEGIFQELVAVWDYIWNVVREQRMFWADLRHRMQPMAFAVMHESAYQALIKNIESQVTYSKLPQDMRSHFDRSMHAMREYQREEAGKKQDGIEDEMATRFTQMFSFERFTDELRRIGTGNGNYLPGERELFNAMRDAYFEKKLTDDQLFAAITPALSARYVHAGLSELNLHFEPLVYADQDYSNEIGRAYAAFVADVSNQVSRGRDVRAYGEFINYSLVVRQADPLFEALRMKAREWDSRLSLMSQQPSPDALGLVVAKFECPMKLSTLQEFLEEFAQDHQDQSEYAMYRDTLQVCAS